jgi:hypothetical protein
LLHIDGTQQLIVNKTLSTLNSSGNYFEISSLTIRSSDVYKVVAYTGSGNSAIFITCSVGDKAIPVAVPRYISVGTEFNLNANVITQTVGFTRARASVEISSDTEYSRQDVSGYRLFITNSESYCPNGALCNFLMEETLDSLSSDTFNANAFAVTNLSISTGDKLMVFSYNQDGNCLTGVSIATGDRAVPIAIATGITQSYDQNLSLNLINATVIFTRSSSAAEFPGTTANSIGYELWILSSNGTMTMRVRKTIAEIGGTSGSSSMNGFVLKNFNIELGDKFRVFAYNQDGTYTSSSPETTTIQDSATPIAIVTNVSVSIDQNHTLNVVTTNVSFVRPSSLFENPNTWQAISGYELYLVHTNETSALIQRKTLFELQTQDFKFILSNQSIQSGDNVKVLSWNTYSSATRGSVLTSVRDGAVPTVLVTGASHTTDGQLDYNVLTHLINFTRGVEVKNLTTDIVGYRLYLCTATGYRLRYADKDLLVNCSFVQQRTCQGLDLTGDSSFNVIELRIEVGDIYQIRSYNSYGDSINSTNVVIRDRGE